LRHLVDTPAVFHGGKAEQFHAAISLASLGLKNQFFVRRCTQINADKTGKDSTGFALICGHLRYLRTNMPFVVLESVG
jgi:hypothetical protein